MVRQALVVELVEVRRLSGRRRTGEELAVEERQFDNQWIDGSRSVSDSTGGCLRMEMHAPKTASKSIISQMT